MPYYPHYIDKGQYVIEDEDYGYRLCQVNFLDIDKILTHEEMTELLIEFTTKILEKLRDKEDL